MFFSRKLSLNKLKQSLHHLAKLYNQSSASDVHKEAFKADLLKLQTLVQENNREEATLLSRDLEKRAKTLFPKPFLRKVLEGTLGLAVALVLATIVRQMWFEPMQIPTGSMRPTFKENDLLTVTKTPYGINIPLVTDHFYFNDQYVQRGSSLIFSGDKLDLPDVETTFLYVFPYTKRYVKRLIGKPGDTLYFYGGSIY
ncbi:MAG: signal peptidase I, partial [Parachlamydiaceae bacterium]